MNERAVPPTVEADLPTAAVVKRRRFSVVWIIPVVAVGIAAWLVYRSVVEAGPQITITFYDGSGLKADATPIKYHGVECGTIESITLSKDLEHVIVGARLDQSAAGLAREGSIFWIVRPELSLAGVRGIETIVTGPFIKVIPGTGKPKRDFEGLREPPPADIEEPRLNIVLKAEELGSLHAGAPVYFREVGVGTVESYDLTDDAKSVEIQVHIDPKYASLVRTTSKFWNVSGFDLRVGLSGAKLDLESLESLLMGGVAFATPEGSGDPVKNGAVFELLDKAPEAEEKRESEAVAVHEPGLEIILTPEQLGSLSVGSPIYYRDVQVGRVEGYDLSDQATWVNVRVNIGERFAPLVRKDTKFWNVSGLGVHVGLLGATVKIESLESLLVGGIAFATPDGAGEQAEDGAFFDLYDKPDDEWLKWSPTIQLKPAQPLIKK